MSSGVFASEDEGQEAPQGYRETRSRTACRIGQYSVVLRQRRSVSLRGNSTTRVQPLNSAIFLGSSARHRQCDYERGETNTASPFTQPTRRVPSVTCSQSPLKSRTRSEAAEGRDVFVR